MSQTNNPAAPLPNCPACGSNSKKPTIQMLKGGGTSECNHSWHEVSSRSQQKRIAVMKGEPMPTEFNDPATPSDTTQSPKCDGCGLTEEEHDANSAHGFSFHAPGSSSVREARVPLTNILSQLCLHISQTGGKGNPFQSMKWDWFVEIAEPFLKERLSVRLSGEASGGQAKVPYPGARIDRQEVQELHDRAGREDSVAPRDFQSLREWAVKQSELFPNAKNAVKDALFRCINKAEVLAEARTQSESPRLFNLLKKICANAHACHYQQNTFPGESDPCGKCANCMADEVLGENWEKREAQSETVLPSDELLDYIHHKWSCGTIEDGLSQWPWKKTGERWRDCTCGLSKIMRAARASTGTVGKEK